MSLRRLPRHDVRLGSDCDLESIELDLVRLQYSGSRRRFRGILTEVSSTAESVQQRVPWNEGTIVGAKPPLRPNHVWSIRTRVAIDSKLRGCDVISLNVDDVAPSGYAADGASVRQCAGGVPKRRFQQLVLISRRSRDRCERHGSRVSLTAAFAALRKMEPPMVLPIRILHLCPVALESMSSTMAQDKPSRVFGVLFLR